MFNISAKKPTRRGRNVGCWIEEHQYARLRAAYPQRGAVSELLRSYLAKHLAALRRREAREKRSA